MERGDEREGKGGKKEGVRKEERKGGERDQSRLHVHHFSKSIFFHRVHSPSSTIVEFVFHKCIHISKFCLSAGQAVWHSGHMQAAEGCTCTCTMYIVVQHTTIHMCTDNTATYNVQCTYNIIVYCGFDNCIYTHVYCTCTCTIMYTCMCTLWRMSIIICLYSDMSNWYYDL